MVRVSGEVNKWMDVRRRKWNVAGRFRPSHGLGKCLVWLRPALASRNASGYNSPGLLTILLNTSIVAMELHQRYKPLCLSQKDGRLLPSPDIHTIQTSALDCPNPQSPSSTTSCAKSVPLPAFTPPLWLLYLCRSFDIEASDVNNFDSNSPWQAPGTTTLRKANSPPIPPLQRKHRQHLHSVATRELGPTSENSTRGPFE